MPLTVDQAVSEVVGKLGGKLAFVGLSVVRDHTNPDVTPAVRDALWYYEAVPADFPAVSDFDLSTIPDPKRYLDACVLETLYRIQGAMLAVDMKVDKNSQNLSQLRDDVAAMVADYQSRVPRPNYPRATIGQLADPLIYPGVTTPTCQPSPIIPQYNPFGYGAQQGWGFGPW